MDGGWGKKKEFWNRECTRMHANETTAAPRTRPRVRSGKTKDASAADPPLRSRYGGQAPADERGFKKKPGRGW